MATALIRLTTGVVYARSISGTLTFVSGGVLALADGSVTAPSLTLASDTNTGLYAFGASGDIAVTLNGTAYWRLTEDSGGSIPAIQLHATAAMSWGSSGVTSRDVALFRDAAATLALRDGAIAQAFNVYNTTNGTDKEFLSLYYSGNIGYLVTRTAGTGTPRPLYLGVSSSPSVQISTAGHLLFNTDNTYDIGASGATRPRDTYVSGRYYIGGSGTATSASKLTKKVTGIADNTATDVLTVTIPNANHAAAVKLTFLSSNGSTDAFESSRVATGHVVVARTTGVVTVVTAATIDDAAIATVAAGATHTLAYNVSAVTGAAGASNSFTVQVTIDDSGNLGSNQVVVLAELINAEATGVTIA